MKKLLVLTFFTGALGMNAYSQSMHTQAKIEDVYTNGFNQQGFHIGASAGFNSVAIINQNSYYTPELEYRVTYAPNGGLVAGYNVTNHLGVQAEAFFSVQGQKYKDEIVGQPIVTRRVESTYFQFPVMFKYMGGLSRVQFYAMGGPQLSILNSSRVTMNGAEMTPTNILKPAAVNSFFEKTEWGIKLALGSDIQLSEKLYLNAGLAFYAGLSDINAEPFRVNGNEFQTKVYKKSTNSFAGVNVGIHYMIKKSRTQ